MEKVEDDCWNRIGVGVGGDRSCARLNEHTHCRNCEVFGAAAAQLMQRTLPEGYRRAWSEHYARPQQQAAHADQAQLAFRLGQQWLALPMRLAVVAAVPAPVRRLPHRQDPALLGIVNVRGHLYPCVSLAEVLEIPRAPGLRNRPQMLVLQFERFAAAVPVDELLGAVRHRQSDLQAVPASLALAQPRFVLGLLAFEQRQIACLDAGLLGYTLARRIT